MDITKNNHSAHASFVAVFFGLVSTIIAVALTFTEPKYLVTIISGIFLLTIALTAGNRDRMVYLSISILAISICFRIGIILFYRYHVGGAPGIELNLTLVSVILFLAIFMYDYSSSDRSSPLKFNGLLFWAVIFYIVAGFLSIYNALQKELVWFQLYRLFILFLVFFAVMNVRNEKMIRWFLFLISVIVVLQTCLAVVQYLTKSTLGLEMLGEQQIKKLYIGQGSLSRATGTIGHPNILAYLYEIAMPICFALYLVEEKFHVRLWYFFSLVMGLVGIITTLSRAGWLTLPLSLCFVLLMVYRRNIFSRKAFIKIFIGSIAGFVFLIVFYPTIEKRYFHESYHSAESRLPMNVAALSVIKQFPITGVGLNNFSNVYKQYDTTGGSRLVGSSGQVVHNLYLLIWGDTGIIGLATFLWIFIATFFVAGRLIARAPPWQRAVTIGIVAGLFAHLLHGLVDPGFPLAMNISILIYSLIGIIGSMSIMNRQDAPA